MNEEQDLTERRAAWFRYQRRWRALHYAIGGLAIAIPPFLASTEAHLPPPATAALLILTSILAGLLTFLKPDARADAYRAAWLRLDEALKRKAGIGGDLLEALREGEDIIGQVRTGELSARGAPQGR